MVTTMADQATAATAAPGSLSVTTNPAGAAIYVDGLQRGISPETISGLTPGEHTILLKLSSYDDLTAQVTITAGQTTIYTKELALPASMQLPALPATTKSPGFEAILGIAAIGMVLLARESPR